MNTPHRPTKSAAGNTYETYADTEQSSESDATENRTAGKPGNSANNELLNKVLSETLSRKHCDPERMLDSLRKWRASVQSDVFDQSTCEKMISQVLDFRLGQSASELTDQLRREVSNVLWENSESRSRIERLWNSIAAV